MGGGVILLLAAGAWTAEIPKVEAHEFTLKNGMHFIVFERPALPVAASAIFFNVGAADEPVGKTGMAHLLEHLMFKGSSNFGTTDWEAERPLFEKANAETERWIAAVDRAWAAAPPGVLKGSEKAPETPEVKALEEEINKTLEAERAYILKDEFWGTYNRNGGSNQNAFTDYDFTGYYVVLPANKIKLWAVMESDRIRDAKFREFFSERNVIMEEKRLSDETYPDSKWMEALASLAFPAHPYGRPIVGYSDDLYHMSIQDVQAFYDAYYKPNNAVAVIVGGVKAGEVKALAETYFEPIPRDQVPKRHWTNEVPLDGPREVTIYFDAQPQRSFAYRTPAKLHPDYPALALASQVLCGGASSRIYRRVVLDEKMANSASCWLGDSRDPNLLTFNFEPFKGRTVDEVESVIREEIARLQKDGPEEKELQKVKNQHQASAIYRLDSPVGFAFWPRSTTCSTAIGRPTTPTWSG
jgi:predicted Zn-dependent peptidase